MTQDYLDQARKLLTETHAVTQTGGTYTPSEMQVESLARALAEFKARTLEEEAKCCEENATKHYHASLEALHRTEGSSEFGHEGNAQFYTDCAELLRFEPPLSANLVVSKTDFNLYNGHNGKFT